MTKGEKRAARKAAQAAGQVWDAAAKEMRPPQEWPRRRVRRASYRGALARADALYRWAIRYDALNGAPENEEDR